MIRREGEEVKNGEADSTKDAGASRSVLAGEEEEEEEVLECGVAKGEGEGRRQDYR